MHTLATIALVFVAASVFFVWTFRFEHIVSDFKHFGYSDTFRNAVGAVKLSSAALLVVGIWSPRLALGAALAMSALMLGAQWSHFRVGNPLVKRLPSALLLILSLFVAAESAGLLG